MEKIILIIASLYFIGCSKNEVRFFNGVSHKAKTENVEYNNEQCKKISFLADKSGIILGELLLDRNNDTLIFADYSIDSYVIKKHYENGLLIKNSQSVNIKDEYKLNIWSTYDSEGNLDLEKSSHVEIALSNLGYMVCIEGDNIDSLLLLEDQQWPDIYQLANYAKKEREDIYPGNCIEISSSVINLKNKVCLIAFMDFSTDSVKEIVLRPLYLNKEIINYNLRND